MLYEARPAIYFLLGGMAALFGEGTWAQPLGILLLLVGLFVTFMRRSHRRKKEWL